MLGKARTLRSRSDGRWGQIKPSQWGQLRPAFSTLADAQQQRLLERLREAGDEAVAFAELHASGIAFPAAVVSELELNGYVIKRV